MTTYHSYKKFLFLFFLLVIKVVFKHSSSGILFIKITNWSETLAFSNTWVQFLQHFSRVLSSTTIKAYRLITKVNTYCIHGNFYFIQFHDSLDKTQLSMITPKLQYHKLKLQEVCGLKKKNLKWILVVVESK